MQAACDESLRCSSVGSLRWPSRPQSRFHSDTCARSTAYTGREGGPLIEPLRSLSQVLTDVHTYRLPYPDTACPGTYYILRPLPQVLSSTFQKNYYIPRMLSQVLVLEVQSRSIVHLENGPPRSNLRKITSSMCFQKFNPEVFLLRRLVSKDRKKLKVQTLHPDTQVQCKEQPVRSYYLSI